MRVNLGGPKILMVVTTLREKKSTILTANCSLRAGNQKLFFAAL